MGLLVRVLQAYMPGPVRRRALTMLFTATAAAFEAAVPPIAGLDARALLAEYARFTRAQAEECLRRGGDVEAIRRRLYANAVAMGRRCRRLLRPRSMSEVMASARMLYGVLDINFQGDARGDAVIPRCYFSRFYTPEVCQLMSALDCGLLAGLADGGELVFTARITEGQPCCRARFTDAPQVTAPAVAG